MKRKVVLLPMILVMMAMIGGCGQKKEDTQETVQEGTAQAETTGESSPVQNAGDGAPDQAETPVSEPAVEPQPEPVPEPQLSGRVVIDIPEGFYEYLSPSGIYVTKKYPEDGSNIYIVTAPLYGTLPEQNEYTRKVNENLSTQVGEVVSVTMEEYEKTTVSGFDAVKVVYSYSYDDLKFKRTEYMVNTNITTTIAYTIVNNAEWGDAFEESELSMHVE